MVPPHQQGGNPGPRNFRAGFFGATKIFVLPGISSPQPSGPNTRRSTLSYGSGLTWSAVSVVFSVPSDGLGSPNTGSSGVFHPHIA